MPASRALGDEGRQVIAAAPAEDRQALAEQAATQAATSQAVAAFREHLLGHFTPVMPANPRLVTRVANTFGMLMTIRLHLNHHEPEEYIARAAILMVRFPSLVDLLLSETDPPQLDPTRVKRDPETGDPVPSPWLRRDVQQLLRGDDGELLDPLRLARCFGREFAPNVRGLVMSVPEERRDHQISLLEQAADASTTAS